MREGARESPCDIDRSAKPAMTVGLFLTQALNGLQLGILLFLLAAGLTLVFGIMNFVNLAHGSLYMMGAYFAAAVFNWTGSFLLAGVVAVPATMLLGVIVERVALIRLYHRDHLDQVLATFGLILFFNELVRIIWGPASVYMNAPDALSGTREPLRAAAIRRTASRSSRVGLAVGAGPAFADPSHAHRHADSRRGQRTRKSSPRWASTCALLNTLVFGLGAALAGLRRLDGRPDPVGAAGHGRADPDPDAGGDRHRRHRHRFAARSTAR